MARSTSIRDRARRRDRANQTACHICGNPIDYTIPTPDPMSYEADHVHPITKGGTDTLNNIKASHRTCNSTKRARLYAPIIRRSGTLD